MDDILFSSDIADELNDLVCKKIANHLFLFCNYEPGIPNALTMDGQYFLGVQNLYRLYIDCSCILPKQNMMKMWLDSASYQKYRIVKNTIQLLRSCIDHNNSSYNGRREEKQLEDYRQWLRRVIQKDTVADQNDYQLLVDALRHLSQQMYDLAKQAIEKFIRPMYPRKSPGFNSGKMKPFGGIPKKILKGIFSWASWKTCILHTQILPPMQNISLIKLLIGVCNFVTVIKAN